MTELRRRGFLQLAMLAPLAITGRRGVARSTARVVVVGGGFAGSSCALALRRLDRSIDVTLIDPDERYVTCPMSNAVLAGWRTMDSLSLGRSGLRDAGVRYVRDRAVGIDAEKKYVSLGYGSGLASITSSWHRVSGFCGTHRRDTMKPPRNACRMRGLPVSRRRCLPRRFTRCATAGRSRSVFLAG